MVNVKSPKCKCGLARPYFNYEGETKGICCASCKEPGMAALSKMPMWTNHPSL